MLDRIIIACEDVDIRLKNCEKKMVSVNLDTLTAENIALKTAVTELVIDMDFLYSTIDQVKGGPLVKAERKKITERLHTMSASIEQFSNSLA